MRNWSIGRDVPKARTKIQPTTQELIDRQGLSPSARGRPWPRFGACCRPGSPTCDLSGRRVVSRRNFIQCERRLRSVAPKQAFMKIWCGRRQKRTMKNNPVLSYWAPLIHSHRRVRINKLADSHDYQILIAE